jgi:sugar phosphate isomerase/epimerase
VLFGGHVKQLEDIEYLCAHRFDFGEVVFRDATARNYWSRERASLPRDFFLIGHGPHEGSPNDLDNLWNRYYPTLQTTVELAAQWSIHFLTVHVWVDPRFVEPTVIREKLRFLRQILAYGQEHNVLISLENLSENVQDLSMVVSSVPELSLTLDIGHGELLAEKNASYGIVEELCPWIGHVHLHDNFGGKGVKDDRHLPIGAGTIKVSEILTKILEKGYAGTLTLELDRDDLADSLGRVRTMIRRIEQDHPNSCRN